MACMCSSEQSTSSKLSPIFVPGALIVFRILHMQWV